MKHGFPTNDRSASWPVVFLGLLLAMSGPASAQTCFRGRPLDQCRTFFLTKFGARLNFTRESAGAGLTDRLTVPITGGVMWNVSRATALGGVLQLDPDTEYSDWFVALGPRVRYWFCNASIDGMATVAVGGGEIRNVTVQGIWMYRDLIGLDAGIVFDRVAGEIYWMDTDSFEDRKNVRPFIGRGWAPMPGPERGPLQPASSPSPCSPIVAGRTERHQRPGPCVLMAFQDHLSARNARQPDPSASRYRIPELTHNQRILRARAGA
jgi:hypothetical protein